MNKEIKKNGTELTGGFLLFLVFFCGISCLSYNSGDVSFNVLTDEKIRNIFGYPGAFAADLFLQTLGFAIVPFLLTLCLWGCLFVSGYKIFLFWLRMPAFVIFIISCCSFIELISSHKDFYYEILPGGYIGYWFYKKFIIKTLIGKIGSFFGLILSISLFGYLSIGLTSKNSELILSNVKKILKTPLIFLIPFQKFFRFCRSLMKHSNSPYKEIDKKRTFISSLFKLLLQLTKVTFSERARNSFKIRQEMSSFANQVVTDLDPTSLEDESEIPSNTNNIQSQRSQISSIVSGEGEISYTGPSVNLLQEAKQIKQSTIDKSGTSRSLTQALLDFGIVGEVSKINTGPVVTLFEFKPKAGTKSSRVIGLSDDIARTMQALSARISVIQGKDALGIELPNKTRATIYLRELLETPEFLTSDAVLPMALGKDIGGNPIVVDMAKMPHLLIAGTTGSGKSVGINAMILSLIYKLSPADCRMIMIDPKMLELSVYDGIPHLMTPVITDSKKAILALKWAVAEMENRYKIMSSLGVRNIINYNTKVDVAIKNKTKLTRQVDVVYNKNLGRMETETVVFEPRKMPYIVLIVDEMADLMIVAGKEVEAQIQRLAQMARAAGIHIIMATQRPSVDVITGVIKANFPSRISFQVTSKIDSRTILGEQGAEQLLGHGDMLFMQGVSRTNRIHGPFVADHEVEAIVKHLKDNNACNYVDIINYEKEDSPMSGSEDTSLFDMNIGIDTEAKDDNDLYKMAIRIVKEERRTSISYIQRKLRIGYNKAANLVEKMEQDGILSSADKTGKRIILDDESD